MAIITNTTKRMRNIFSLGMLISFLSKVCVKNKVFVIFSDAAVSAMEACYIILIKA